MLKFSCLLSRMQEQFIAAAAEFLQCSMGTEAARCLYNAKEITLAAKLFEKIGQVKNFVIIKI